MSHDSEAGWRTTLVSNPNLAQEAARIIRGGGTVVLVHSGPPQRGKLIVDGIADHLHEVARYRHVNGEEGIDHASGGRALSVHLGQLHRVRGMEVDYAILDDFQLLGSTSVMGALLPSFGTKDRPRIAVVA